MAERRVLLVGDAQVAAVLRLRHRALDLVLLLGLRVPWRTWSSLSSPARYIGGESAILFLKQLRALRSQVPVIVVSGSAKAEAEVLSRGAFAFVPKPIDLSELGCVVAAASAVSRSPAV